MKQWLLMVAAVLLTGCSENRGQAKAFSLSLSCGKTLSAVQGAAVNGGGTFIAAKDSSSLHHVHFGRYEFLLSFDHANGLIGFNEMKAIEILGWYQPLGFDFPLECKRNSNENL